MTTDAHILGAIADTLTDKSSESIDSPALSKLHTSATSTWINTIGNTGSDEGRFVSELSNGNLASVGTTTSDGSVLDDSFFSVSTSTGETILAKRIEGTGNDEGEYITEILDGFLILSEQEISGLKDILLVKTDSLGNKDLARTYGDTIENDWVSLIKEIPGGDYVILALTKSAAGAGLNDILLIRLTNTFTRVFTKSLGLSKTESGRSLQLTSDSGAIIFGDTDSIRNPDEDFLLVKLNSSWNPTEAKAYGGTGVNQGFAVMEVSDGHIAVGVTNIPGNYDAAIFKVDKTNLDTIIWAIAFGGTDIDGIYDIQDTSSGNLITVGKTQSFGAASFVPFIAIVDTNGTLLKFYKFSDTYVGLLYSIQPTADGGFIATGKADNINGGDVILVKLDENGEAINCSDIIEDITATVLPTVTNIKPLLTVTDIPIGPGAGELNVNDLSAAIIETDVTASLVIHDLTLNEDPVCVPSTPTPPVPTPNEISPTSTWITAIGGIGADEGDAAIETTSGTIAFTGKTTNFGAVLQDAVFGITTSTGTLITAKRIEGTSDDVGEYLQEVSDGFVLLGNKKDLATGFVNVLLVKINNSYAIDWANIYGDIGDIDSGFFLYKTALNDFIIVGRTETSAGAGGTDLFILKISSIGNLVWSKLFGGSIHDYAEDLLELTDTNLVTVGRTSSFGLGNYDVLAIKTDSNGNKLWTKAYGESGNDYGYSAIEVTDGIVISGWSDSFSGNMNFLIMKIDKTTGDKIWVKEFGGANIDQAYSMAKTSDDGFILVGRTLSFGVSAFSILIIKTDSSGNPVWAKVFEGTGIEEAYSIHPADGGFIITGNTESHGAGDKDIILIKIDENGNVNGCDGRDVFGDLTVNDITTFFQVTTIPDDVVDFTTISQAPAAVTIHDITPDENSVCVPSTPTPTQVPAGVTPTAPAITPTAPALTLTPPVITPTAPAITPTAPVATLTPLPITPTAPYDTPTAPINTPTAPALTPTAPYDTPTAPILTPTAVASTPTAPHDTPTAPVPTPTERFPSPTAIWDTPTGRFPSPSAIWDTPTGRFPSPTPVSMLTGRFPTPTGLLSTPTAPHDTPTAPVPTPTAPVITPTAPHDTPTAPQPTPTPPIITPTAPALTPTAPVITPTAPALTPTAPVVTPTAPYDTPTAPALTPTAPVITPTIPHATPTALHDTPTAPALTPTPPLTTPTSLHDTPTAPRNTVTPGITPLYPTPTAPAITPTAVIATPTAPILTPTQLINTPTAPIITPTPPLITPTAPIITPTPPLITPTAPIITPTPPITTPTAPHATPTAQPFTPTQPRSTLTPPPTLLPPTPHRYILRLIINPRSLMEITFNGPDGLAVTLDMDFDPNAIIGVCYQTSIARFDYDKQVGHIQAFDTMVRINELLTEMRFTLSSPSYATTPIDTIASSGIGDTQHLNAQANEFQLNNPPVVDQGMPEEIMVKEGSTLVQEVPLNTCKDVDGDTIVYNIDTDTVDWCDYNIDERLLSCTPTAADQTATLSLQGDDGCGGICIIPFQIKTTSDTPTEGESIPNLTATAGKVFTYTFASTAIDTETVRWVQDGRETKLPNWLTFNDKDTISGTPGINALNEREYTLRTKGTHEGKRTSIDFALHVEYEGPTCSEINPPDAPIGREFNYIAPECESSKSLSYSVQRREGTQIKEFDNNFWLRFVDSTRLFYGTPTVDGEAYEIIYRVWDGLRYTEIPFTITTLINYPPEFIDTIPKQSIEIDTEYSFTTPLQDIVTDRNNHALTLTAVEKDKGIPLSWLSVEVHTLPEDPETKHVTLSGQPGENNMETYTVILTADDGYGGTDTTEIVFEVHCRGWCWVWKLDNKEWLFPLTSVPLTLFGIYRWIAPHVWDKCLKRFDTVRNLKVKLGEIKTLPVKYRGNPRTFTAVTAKNKDRNELPTLGWISPGSCANTMVLHPPSNGDDLLGEYVIRVSRRKPNLGIVAAPFTMGELHVSVVEDDEEMGALEGSHTNGDSNGDSGESPSVAPPPNPLSPHYATYAPGEAYGQLHEAYLQAAHYPPAPEQEQLGPGYIPMSALPPITYVSSAQPPPTSYGGSAQPPPASLVSVPPSHQGYTPWQGGWEAPYHHLRNGTK